MHDSTTTQVCSAWDRVWLQDVDPFGDLNTEIERTLGRLVKEKYKTDFYMLYNYPLAVSISDSVPHFGRRHTA